MFCRLFVISLLFSVSEVTQVKKKKKKVQTFLSSAKVQREVNKASSECVYVGWADLFSVLLGADLLEDFRQNVTDLSLWHPILLGTKHQGQNPCYIHCHSYATRLVLIQWGRWIFFSEEPKWPLNVFIVEMCCLLCADQSSRCRGHS